MGAAWARHAISESAFRAVRAVPADVIVVPVTDFTKDGSG
jgi:hypothetical protein